MSNNSKQNMPQKDKTKRVSKAWSGTLPKGATNTIRSKIEDKLTEEKLKDRKNAANANTPWAPSGPERIEIAYGKFLLWARQGEDVSKIHCLLAVVLRKA